MNSEQLPAIETPTHREIDGELQDAVLSKDMVLVWGLVDQGADLEARVYGQTAFLSAAYYLAQDIEGLIDVTVDLFTSGVDVHASDDDGRGFAAYANQNSSVTMVYLAVAFGIDTADCLRDDKPMSDFHAEAAAMTRLEAAVTITSKKLVGHLFEQHGECISGSELERLRATLKVATEPNAVAVRDMLSAFCARRAALDALDSIACIQP